MEKPLFPQLGSIGLVSDQGQPAACQILSLNRDGSATVNLILRSGLRLGRIVARNEIDDPTPLNSAEQQELLELARRQRQLDYRDRRRLQDLRLRVAHQRILQRIAPQLQLANEVAA